MVGSRIIMQRDDSDAGARGLALTFVGLRAKAPSSKACVSASATTSTRESVQEFGRTMLSTDQQIGTSDLLGLSRELHLHLCRARFMLFKLINQHCFGGGIVCPLYQYN